MLVGSTSLPTAGQRRSIVSDASSNTTSGIVSDRQHTHDDSDVEHDGDVDSSPIVSELSLSGGYHSSLNQSSCEMLIESPPPSILHSAASEKAESRKDSLGGPCPSDHTITAGSDAEEETEDGPENKSSTDSPTIRSSISVELDQHHRIVGHPPLDRPIRMDLADRPVRMDPQDRPIRNAVVHNPAQDVRNRSCSEPPSVDLRRLDELAKSAEHVIAAELSTLIGSNRSSESSMVGRTRDQSVGSSSSSKFDLSDLRQRTLNGYPEEVGRPAGYSKAISVATFNIPAPSLSTATDTWPSPPSMLCSLDEATQTIERKMTNTLATQTELFDVVDRATVMSIPSTVPLSDPELQDKERQLFRIVSKQQSFGNQAEVVTVQAPPPAPQSPKTNNSNLPPYPGRTASPPETMQIASGPQATVLAPPPAHYLVAEQQAQQLSIPRGQQYALTPALSVEQQQRDWYRDTESPTMLLPAQQSYSFHDLSALRQPPGYTEAVRKQHNGVDNHRSAHSHHNNNKRWTTVSGIDPEIMEQLAYAAAPYPSHHARSEPRLDQQWLAMNDYQAMSVPLASAPLNGVSVNRTHMTPSGLFVKNPPRLASTGRSGASRGINRVQSMPGHSAA
uniref:Uncharacterized protein n=1 Tax=Plectus sambesii TaxID=2011161 RepID=A0A914UT02_9BILA